MTAYLGMYDMPHLHAANDALWAALRAELGFGPDRLDRGRDPWAIWTDPGLVFAQTCSLPYRTRLAGKVQIVATPDYGLSGCAPGKYNSVILVRAEDPAANCAALAGRRMAFNDAVSQSGWAAPVLHLAGWDAEPGALVETGAHAASARAVATGAADFAGVDALTWHHLQAAAPDQAAALRVLDRTEPTPALPFITGPAQDAGRIARALAAALDRLDPVHRDALHLRGIVQLPDSAYLELQTPPPPR